VSAATGGAWYVGVTGSGKTTLALQHAGEASRENGWPVLAIDTGGVDQLAHVPAARSVSELVRQVWSEGVHARIVPNDQNDVDDVVNACLHFRHVNLIVDEAADWIDSARGARSPLMKLLRRHRHARARIFLTTQHLSADVPQRALSCGPALYVFHCDSGAVLDRLERDYGLDRGTVRNLPRGKYLRVQLGFPA